MNVIHVVLLVVALVCFLMAAVNVAARVNLLALGFVFVVFDWLLAAAGVSR